MLSISALKWTETFVQPDNVPENELVYMLVNSGNSREDRLEQSLKVRHIPLLLILLNIGKLTKGRLVQLSKAYDIPSRTTLFNTGKLTEDRLEQF